MRLMLLWALRPLLAAALSYRGSRDRGPWPWRKSTLVAGGRRVHLGLVVSLWAYPRGFRIQTVGSRPIRSGLLVLTLTSVLFFVTALYTVAYLERERPRGGRVFVTGLLGLPRRSLDGRAEPASRAAVGGHRGHHARVWRRWCSTATIEGRSRQCGSTCSISSVGIALALLGIFFLATAQHGVPGRPLDPCRSGCTCRTAASGVAPRRLHLPAGWASARRWDSRPCTRGSPTLYGEAPSLIGGLMRRSRSPAVRFSAWCAPLRSSWRPVSGRSFNRCCIGFGLLSMVVAAAFIIGQSDLKRLLAYSSVEHMGLLVIGLGFGGVGTYGSVLHMVNNGLWPRGGSSWSPGTSCSQRGSCRCLREPRPDSHCCPCPARCSCWASSLSRDRRPSASS